MVRLQLEAEPQDAEKLRAEILLRGFVLQPGASVRRRKNAHPESDEAYFEERYGHPDGNVVRFYPHTRYASGELQGQPVCFLIEFRPEVAMVPKGPERIQRHNRSVVQKMRDEARRDPDED